MANVQAVIDLPEDLYLSLSSVGLTREKLARESRKLLALKFYKGKVLSLGKATELSGLSKWDFIDYLGENEVAVVNFDDDEMSRELRAVDQVKKPQILSHLPPVVL
jgi:predicted HTH domain antitoxin